jgi:hypothetical protein
MAFTLYAREHFSHSMEISPLSALLISANILFARATLPRGGLRSILGSCRRPPGPAALVCRGIGGVLRSAGCERAGAPAPLSVNFER